MHEITYEKFCSFIQDNIVNDEKGSEIIKEFLLNNFDGSSGETVKSTIEPSVLLGDCDNLFIPKCNIYINLKRLTILVLACICDIYITKGAATALGVAVGKINACITKLDREDCCVFSKVLFYSMLSNGISETDLLNEYSKICSCKASNRCPYFEEEGICGMKETKCMISVNNLISGGVVENKGGLLFIAK